MPCLEHCLPIRFNPERYALSGFHNSFKILASYSGLESIICCTRLSIQLGLLGSTQPLKIVIEPSRTPVLDSASMRSSSARAMDVAKRNSVTVCPGGLKCHQTLPVDFAKIMNCRMP